jgi:hypothetical protein
METVLLWRPTSVAHGKRIRSAQVVRRDGTTRFSRAAIREPDVIDGAHMLERGHQVAPSGGGYVATEREARCIGTSWNERWQVITTRSLS